MSSTASNLIWVPFLTLFKKEVLRFWRVIAQTILIPLVNSTLYLMIFGVSLGNSIQVGSSHPYIAFLIPGLIMMGVLNNAFQNSSSSIATSKFHGDLEDLRTVPLTHLQIVCAMSLAGMVRGFVVGLVTYSVGQAFFYVTQNDWLVIAHPLALVFFLCTGGFAFSSLGIAIGFRSKSIDQLSAVGGFILLPLLYLGGVFFPLTNLHPFWQTLSKANPMLYFINGVRFGVLGTSDISAMLCAVFSLVTVLITFGLAWRAVKNGPYTRW